MSSWLRFFTNSETSSSGDDSDAEQAYRGMAKATDELPATTTVQQRVDPALANRIQSIEKELASLKASAGLGAAIATQQANVPDEFAQILAQGDAVAKLSVQRGPTNIAKPWLPPTPSQATGTGWFIHRDGYMLTNYHVIESATQITVELNSKRDVFVEATVVAVSPKDDVALIKLTDASLKALGGPDSIVNMTLGDSTKLKSLSVLVAIGNPFGEQQKVITGHLSGWQVALDKYLASTTVPLNSGSSGSGIQQLTDGKVVGIGVAAVVGANSTTFMIPAQRVKAILPELMRRADPKNAGKLPIVIEKKHLPFEVAKLDKYAWQEFGLKDQDNGIEVMSLLDEQDPRNKLLPRDILTELDIQYHDLTNLEPDLLLKDVDSTIKKLPIKRQKCTFPGKRSGIVVYDWKDGKWEENHITKLRTLNLEEWVEYQLPTDLKIKASFYRNGKPMQADIELVTPPSATTGVRELFPDLQPVDYIILFGVCYVQTYAPFMKFMSCVKDHAYEKANHVIVTQVFPRSHVSNSGKIGQLDELISIEHEDKVYPVQVINDIVTAINQIMTAALAGQKHGKKPFKEALVRLNYRHGGKHPKSVLINLADELSIDKFTYSSNRMAVPDSLAQWWQLAKMAEEAPAAPVAPSVANLKHK